MGIEEVNLDFAIKSYKRFLANKIIDSTGCFIPNKKPRDDGYVRFSVTRGSTKAAFGETCGERTFYLHHLTWYAEGNRVPESSTTMHVSHLCSNSRCFNIQHLVLEDPRANNSRKNCLVSVACPCGCKHVFWTCKHTPRCIPHASLIPLE